MAVESEKERNSSKETHLLARGVFAKSHSAGVRSVLCGCAFRRYKNKNLQAIAGQDGYEVEECQMLSCMWRDASDQLSFGTSSSDSKPLKGVALA
eukprot:6456335-Amphidinium_carterae.1